MKTEKETYFSQLDGIRFLAVALVLFDHWMAETNIVPLGPLGVTMFFVLSGFLITRILIQSKLKDETIGRSHWFSVRQFIIRRSLRIFPIYFLVIFACLYFDVPPVRQTWAWCIFYATNIYMGFKQTWMGLIDHTWSLAVEEQYYLIFPYLILFLPKRFFIRVLGLMIVLAVGLRLYFSVAGFSWITPYVLMPTCLDSFGLGGLMAYFFTFHQDDIFQKLAKTRYVWLLLVVLVGYFAVNRIAFENPHNWFSDTFERLLGSAFCFFLIANAVKGYSGAMQTFLQNGIVSYLGRISYGLYLYHNFVFNHFHTPPTHITYRILHKAERILPFLKDNLAFQLCLFWGLTIVVATISWYLIEKPVNDLKKYFKY